MADINDPIDWKLDANGDIEILIDRDEPVIFTTSLEAVTQAIELAVTLFEGEWFLDRELGVAYYQDVLGQKFDQTAVIATFRENILDVDDVTEIVTLAASFNAATREVTVNWEVLTPFGNTNGSTTV